MIESQPLPALFTLIEQYTLYLAFLKEYGKCGDERQEEIIKQIEEIFSFINDRSGGKKKRSSDDSLDSSYRVSR